MIYTEAEKKIKELKKVITEHEVTKSHPRVKVNDWTIQKVKKKGSIDYSKVPEIGNIDLEKYRKKGSEYYTITRLKK